MNPTIGLAAMKIRTASPNSATPPQNRRGIWGTRISLPASNGPPRSNGSNGRYRLPTLERTLDGRGASLRHRVQRTIVRPEVVGCVRRRIFEVPAHAGAKALGGIRGRPSKHASCFLGAGGDMLRKVAGLLQVVRESVIRHPHELRV